MPDILEYTLAAVDELGAGLELRLLRAGDRLRHEVRVAAGSVGGEAPWVLASREGAAAEAWPDSPPLQQALLHALPDGAAALLLVGQAGQSHWSLSIEARPRQRALVFDAACRLKSPAGFLGATYQGAGSWRDAGPNAVASPRGAGWPIVVSGDDATECRLATPGRLATDAPARIVLTAPAEPGGPATVRWKYRIALAESERF